MAQLRFWPESTQTIVNVSSVRQLSPFRYPGGKTWLVPRVKQWLLSLVQRPSLFIEPFAGGAIVSLTVAAEKLADHVVFVELDEQVAAVWHTIFSEDAEWLCKQILNFEMTDQTVDAVIANAPTTRKELAFQTIVRNRVNRGGILAPGAGRIRKGEKGKGIRSRWYPETLCKRIRYLNTLTERITFIHGDGTEVLRQYKQRGDTAYFIDPPYTTKGKRAGARLYRYYALDHEKLFAQIAAMRGQFLMTYENCSFVQMLAERHNFQYVPIAMKNTHHARMTELLIGKSLDWVSSSEYPFANRTASK